MTERHEKTLGRIDEVCAAANNAKHSYYNTVARRDMLSNMKSTLTASDRADTTITLTVNRGNANRIGEFTLAIDSPFIDGIDAACAAMVSLIDQQIVEIDRDIARDDARWADVITVLDGGDLG